MNRNIVWKICSILLLSLVALMSCLNSVGLADVRSLIQEQMSTNETSHDYGQEVVRIGDVTWLCLTESQKKDAQLISCEVLNENTEAHRLEQQSGM